MPSLKEWLADKGMSHGEFGERIERTAEAVRRYAEGLRIPDRETMPLIFKATDGAVDANSFHNLSFVEGDSAAETTASPRKFGENISPEVRAA